MTKQEIINKIIEKLSKNSERTITFNTLCKLAEKELFRWTMKDLVYYNSFMRFQKDNTIYS